MNDVINDKNSEVFIQNLVYFIDSNNENEINKENCLNYINENTNLNLNENEINNIFEFTFGQKQTINKQEALNKLSSLFQKEEKKTKQNKKEIIYPKNKIDLPLKELKQDKNRSKSNSINDFILQNQKIFRSHKKFLAADRIFINRIDINNNKNHLFEKINNFKNEFFEVKNNIIPNSNLPVNIKPIIYESKNYNFNYDDKGKKKYREEFSIKNYNLRNNKERKEYINNIRDKLKNFVHDKKERDNNFKEDMNLFDNINEMIEKFQLKKKE